jgi:hypothetical protein
MILKFESIHGDVIARVNEILKTLAQYGLITTS